MGLILGIFCVVWSSYSASRFIELLLGSKDPALHHHVSSSSSLCHVRNDHFLLMVLFVIKQLNHNQCPEHSGPPSTPPFHSPQAEP